MIDWLIDWLIFPLYEEFYRNPKNIFVICVSGAPKITPIRRTALWTLLAARPVQDRLPLSAQTWHECSAGHLLPRGRSTARRGAIGLPLSHGGGNENRPESALLYDDEKFSLWLEGGRPSGSLQVRSGQRHRFVEGPSQGDEGVSWGCQAESGAQSTASGGVGQLWADVPSRHGAGNVCGAPDGAENARILSGWHRVRSSWRYDNFDFDSIFGRQFFCGKTNQVQ